MMSPLANSLMNRQPKQQPQQAPQGNGGFGSELGGGAGIGAPSAPMGGGAPSVAPTQSDPYTPPPAKQNGAGNILGGMLGGGFMGGRIKSPTDLKGKLYGGGFMGGQMPPNNGGWMKTPIAGPDGKMYGGGFAGGNMGQVYNPSDSYNTGITGGMGLPNSEVPRPDPMPSGGFNTGFTGGMKPFNPTSPSDMANADQWQHIQQEPQMAGNVYTGENTGITGGRGIPNSEVPQAPNGGFWKGMMGGTGIGGMMEGQPKPMPMGGGLDMEAQVDPNNKRAGNLMQTLMGRM